MKYVYPLDKDIDVESLKDEIKSAGIDLKDIHIGNGVIVIESEELTDQKFQAMITTIQDHAPLLFVWVEGGQTMRRMIRSTEDMNRLTAMRVRSAVSLNDDPIQGQIKILTKLLTSLYKNILTASSLNELKITAQNDVAQFQSFIDKRALIIQEGKAFKTANNL